VFVLSLLAGLVMLVLGAEFLVRGGGQLALALRVPALVVGLTIVAFGTSTPELLVSVTAAMAGSTEMSLANVTGSNIANITIVLGLAALVRPLAVERTLMRREIPSCMLLSLAVPLVCIDGVISQGDGALLLLGGVLYNAWLLYEAMRGRAPALDDDLEAEDGGSRLKYMGVFLLGLVVLVVGARLFVNGAVAVAQALNLSDRFIGLTVVALGTSAPEIATGMVSAHKGEVDLAVGNSLGSNLLNIAVVLGITAIISPIVIQDTAAFSDMGVGVAATALLVVFVLKGSITRIEGFLLAAGYTAYILAGYFFGDASIS
jgi:cation:H+ antiporter